MWIHFAGSFFSFLVSYFACGSTSLGRFFPFLVSYFACGSTSLGRFFPFWSHISLVDPLLWVVFSPFWSHISLVDPLLWVVFFLSGLIFRLWIHFSGSFFFFLVSNFACGSTSLGRF